MFVYNIVRLKHFTWYSIPPPSFFFQVVEVMLRTIPYHIHVHLASYLLWTINLNVRCGGLVLRMYLYIFLLLLRCFFAWSICVECTEVGRGIMYLSIDVMYMHEFYTAHQPTNRRGRCGAVNHERTNGWRYILGVYSREWIYVLFRWCGIRSLFILIFLFEVWGREEIGLWW